MSVAVEEFFNRVHNRNDGRFGTSGTGGGHYAGRGKGAKRPALKKSSGSAPAKAAPSKGVTVQQSARVKALMEKRGMKAFEGKSKASQAVNKAARLTDERKANRAKRESSPDHAMNKAFQKSASENRDKRIKNESPADRADRVAIQKSRIKALGEKRGMKAFEGKAKASQVVNKTAREIAERKANKAARLAKKSG